MCNLTCIDVVGKAGGVAWRPPHLWRFNNESARAKETTVIEISGFLSLPWLINKRSLVSIPLSRYGDLTSGCNVQMGTI